MIPIPGKLLISYHFALIVWEYIRRNECFREEFETGTELLRLFIRIIFPRILWEYEQGDLFRLGKIPRFFIEVVYTRGFEPIVHISESDLVEVLGEDLIFGEEVIDPHGIYEL